MRTLAMLLVAALAALVPDPCWALISWVEVDPRGSGTQIGGGEKCWKLTVTTANETDTSEFFFVGGSSITLQCEGDATGAGASSLSLRGCTSPATAACAPLNLVPGGTSTLDCSAQRGSLTPFTVPGWIEVDPDAATIEAGETQETLVCRVP